jgi:hypothetical protein
MNSLTHFLDNEIFESSLGVTQMGSKYPVSGKMPVSRRAIIQRINRKLAHSRVQMCADRRRKDVFYLIDMKRNRVVEEILDMEAKARELEVLMPWEEEE